jgi:hypothetical protein
MYPVSTLSAKKSKVRFAELELSKLVLVVVMLVVAKKFLI